MQVCRKRELYLIGRMPHCLRAPPHHGMSRSSSSTLACPRLGTFLSRRGAIIVSQIKADEGVGTAVGMHFCAAAH